ncbi:MAG: carboxypeptidase-like regulatory domain-containing protein [Gemmatimonadetes bacterium]|nr:carboxypeptidase-like regulatory domain-containing protein [Gemmatimonadota bacterium]
MSLRSNLRYSLRILRKAPAFAAVVIAIAGAAPASGQRIQGQVIDSISGVPVGRGFILLLDATGRELIRDLTTPDGRFSLAALGAGTYRLRSERIGYRAWESTDLELTARQTYRLNPLVNALPRRLASIMITGESECEDRKSADTGLLWEEARKALIAASWSAEQEMYVHRVHRHRRDLNTSRDEVLSEEITVLSVQTELPFVSLDPLELAERGYVVGDENDGWTWWGPDANVFLDPSFHRTHCFWAVRGEDDRTGLIGLAFEPVPDREVPDVEGTLWLDEETGELRTVEFRYVEIPMRVSEDHLGGWATFLPMPSGAWILDRWQLLIPNISWRGRRRPRIAGYRDTGGRVLEVHTLEGNRVYEAPGLVTVRGTVFDSVQNGPPVGDVVSVVGTEYRATVDRAGRFEMRVLLEGPQDLTTTRLDWLGYPSGRVHLDLAPADTLNVRLDIPSLEILHHNLCPRSPPTSNLVVHGEVRTPEGRGVANAKVTARWGLGVERKSETDETGEYVLCDLPRDAPITIDVDHRFVVHDPIEIRFVGRDVVIGGASDGTSYYVPDRIVRIGLEVRPERREDY